MVGFWECCGFFGDVVLLCVFESSGFGLFLIFAFVSDSFYVKLVSGFCFGRVGFRGGGGFVCLVFFGGGFWGVFGGGLVLGLGDTEVWGNKRISDRKKTIWCFLSFLVVFE